MNLWDKSDEITGFLDQGTNISGELQFSNTLRIDGDFYGSITSGDSLIVGEQAIVRADIEVGAIEIHGKVLGNVRVKHRAEIFSTGRLCGDLETPVLIVQAGAVLEGRSQMPRDSESNGQSSHDLAPVGGAPLEEERSMSPKTRH